MDTRYHERVTGTRTTVVSLPSASRIAMSNWPSSTRKNSSVSLWGIESTSGHRLG